MSEKSSKNSENKNLLTEDLPAGGLTQESFQEADKPVLVDPKSRKDKTEEDVEGEESGEDVEE